MSAQGQLLDLTVAEYQTIAGEGVRGIDTSLCRDRLVALLCSGHDWTESGARAVVGLADEYGAFMLRNALALAVVLGREDGDLGL